MNSPSRKTFCLRTLGGLSALALGFCAPSVQASFQIAEKGQPRCVIILQADSTEAEKHAINELAQTLKQITGAEFEVQAGKDKAPSRAITLVRLSAYS